MISIGFRCGRGRRRRRLVAERHVDGGNDDDGERRRRRKTEEQRNGEALEDGIEEDDGRAHDDRRCRERHRPEADRASVHDGFLDRGPYVWSRVVHPRDLVTKTFAVHGPAGPEGYVVLGHRFHAERDATSITLTDAIALTGRAARRILAFVGEYRSLCERVTWYGSPTSELVMELPERHHRVSIPDYFMLRVATPEIALSSRGYPRLVRAHVKLELADRTLPESSGTYAVSCDGGVGAASKIADKGDATIDERGLAALFSGFATPWTLRAMGRLDAPDPVCETLAAMFAARTPCIVDMF